jgi:hypothetical protein
MIGALLAAWGGMIPTAYRRNARGLRDRQAFDVEFESPDPAAASPPGPELVDLDDGGGARPWAVSRATQAATSRWRIASSGMSPMWGAHALGTRSRPEPSLSAAGTAWATTRHASPGTGSGRVWDRPRCP